MSFCNLALSSNLLTALPKQYKQATSIQQLAIPAIIEKRDVLALAQTGSGKTLAFGLPILDMLKADLPYPQALIIAPTRELVQQIAQELTPFAGVLKLDIATLVGGEAMELQAQALTKGAQVIVATPGRLLAMLNEAYCQVEHFKHVVLDEADRLLEMGFWHDIQAILQKLPNQRQNCCFSATLPKSLEKELDSVLTNAQRLEAQQANTVVEEIDEKLYLVNKGSKAQVLLWLLQQSVATAKQNQQTLVFIGAKDNADALCKRLTKAGLQVAALHGNKDQSEREAILADFKAKKLQVLIATDLLARGIHIDALPQVINFDLPMSAPVYVHRVGRTARAGQTGQAISLVSHGETDYLQAIRSLTNKELPLVELAEFPVTDKPATGESKRKPRDKKANRRSAQKRSAKQFQSKPKRN